MGPSNENYEPLPARIDRRGTAIHQTHHNPYSYCEIGTFVHSHKKNEKSPFTLCLYNIFIVKKTEMAYFVGSKVASHSTSCSAERETRGCPPSTHCPSRFPTVLNAQHDPTEPWFFTLVTTPFSRQSNESDDILKKLWRTNVIMVGNIQVRKLATLI